MNWYDIAWLIWTLGFAGIEGTAIVHHYRRGTLSWRIWTIFATNQNIAMTPWVGLRRFALAGVLMWGVVHLMSGGSVHIFG